MHNPSSDKLIIALGNWLTTPAGQYVCEWEQQCLDNLTADIFGFNALQIGLPQIDALAASRMPQRWVSDIHFPPDEPATVAAGGAAVVSRVKLLHDFNELPFPSQSLDLVVLPHILEFAGEPHQILREVERVLIPEGQLIICGFNPASLWGARQGMGRLGGAPYLPRDGEFISLPRLKDWLKLLNMGINQARFGCYAPPSTSQTWLRRFSFMEKAGPRWWPYFGAVYVVHAIKRIKGMHLIGPAWARQQVTASSGVPATNKTQNNPT